MTTCPTCKQTVPSVGERLADRYLNDEGFKIESLASCIDAAIADAKAEEREAQRKASGAAPAKSPEPSAPTTGDYGEEIAERNVNPTTRDDCVGIAIGRGIFTLRLENNNALNLFRAFVRNIANAGLAEGEKRERARCAVIAQAAHDKYWDRERVASLILLEVRNKIAGTNVSPMKGASDAATG